MKSDKEFLREIYQKADLYQETKPIRTFPVKKILCELAAAFIICILSVQLIGKTVSPKPVETQKKTALSNTKTRMQKESRALPILVYGTIVSINELENQKDEKNIIEIKLNVEKNPQTGSNFLEGESIQILYQKEDAFDAAEQDVISCEIVDTEEGYILQNYQVE
ncbi:MAG: hypothetical protein RSJ40_03760 [Acetivibrio sp.]